MNGVALALLLLTYVIVGIALIRGRESLQERALLEAELLAGLDEVEAQRTLLNAEFAKLVLAKRLPADAKPPSENAA